MKTKQIPALITLTAGLVTCIISAIGKVSMEEFLKSLCMVIIIFFILGCIIKLIMDKNFPLEENEIEEEPQEEAEQEQETEETEETQEKE